jgi:hypothetical protein
MFYGCQLLAFGFQINTCLINLVEKINGTI